MAYQQRNDSFSLFKNDRKEKDSHPDYRGDGMIGGRAVRVSAWIKEGRNGKYMSCSVTPKDEDQPRRGSSQDDRRPLSEVIDDSVPF